MSGEKSVDVEKINNNEKGFEPAHIRSVISLALFSFVFLGMEFFFDSGAAEFVDARPEKNGRRNICKDYYRKSRYQRI